MDGSSSSIVINSGYVGSSYDLVFTLDHSQQVLYWINGTRYNHCYLQRSNTDGSNRSIVFNATEHYSGGCSHYYHRYYSTQLDMDFFGGAVYTHSYYGDIQATNTEGIRTINSYRSYLCNQQSFHGFKVISSQRQLRSIDNNTLIFTELTIYCYSIQVSIHVPITMVDVLTFACSVLPILMATLVHVTVGHDCYQTKETALPTHKVSYCIL